MKFKKRVLCLTSLLLVVLVGSSGCSRADKRLEVDAVVHNYTGEDLKEIGYKYFDENGEVISSGGVVNADNSTVKSGQKLYLNLDYDRFQFFAIDVEGNVVESAVLRKSDVISYVKVVKNEDGKMELVVSTERISLDEVEKFLGFDILEEVASVRLMDTHGGFHGDGVSAVEVVVLDKDREQIEKKTSNWKKISKMNKELEEFLYPNDEIGGDGDLNQFGLVKPKKGVYKFFDSQEESNNEKGIFNRYSLNFMVAIYDYDSGRISFVRMDT